MGLLNAPSQGASIMIIQNSKQSLNRISDIISKHGGTAMKRLFDTAVTNTDFKQINQVLYQLIKRLTGNSEISDALIEFAEQFPDLNPELADKVRNADSEMGMIKAIDEYYDEIVDIINDHIRNKKR